MNPAGPAPNLVLLIDDEPAMDALVRMSLPDPAIRVVRAGSLVEALEAARRERPAVVLLDLALRSEDGLAILEPLRQDPAMAGVPVVAFTVHASREREALERGVDAFVAKPFEVERFRAVMQRFLS